MYCAWKYFIGFFKPKIYFIRDFWTMRNNARRFIPELLWLVFFFSWRGGIEGILELYGVLSFKVEKKTTTGKRTRQSWHLYQGFMCCVTSFSLRKEWLSRRWCDDSRRSSSSSKIAHTALSILYALFNLYNLLRKILLVFVLLLKVVNWHNKFSSQNNRAGILI